MVSHPETGSDSPIGSDRDRGRYSTPNPAMNVVIANFSSGMSIFRD